MRILLTEDDRAIASAVKKRLLAENCIVDICENGPDAYDYMVMTDYDVIIMDIMLPGEDGLSVVRRGRAAGVETPILFLTARDTVADRVTGLDAGGDDYLVKPFALDELMARIRVLLRRNSVERRVSNLLKVADLEMDLSSRRVCRAGNAVSLTAKEYALLEYLIRNKGLVLSREQIETNLWSGDTIVGSNVVDVYIRMLRKKVDAEFEPKLIQTVRGYGYTLKEPEA